MKTFINNLKYQNIYPKAIMGYITIVINTVILLEP